MSTNIQWYVGRLGRSPCDNKGLTKVRIIQILPQKERLKYFVGKKSYKLSMQKTYSFA